VDRAQGRADVLRANELFADPSADCFYRGRRHQSAPDQSAQALLFASDNWLFALQCGLNHRGNNSRQMISAAFELPNSAERNAPSKNGKAPEAACPVGR
jgi:hypothetical protein